MGESEDHEVRQVAKTRLPPRWSLSERVMLLGDDGVVQNGAQVLLVDEARADVVGKMDGVEDSKLGQGYPEEGGFKKKWL
ncbi:hypothetical protein C1H46_015679 [Malus baccata]|uniref:Uncharacterized protein n=1 Tax=Malus baccata TaxID=106549 RepID=A0A540MIR1_MALBA|nr:hypothetical protein C1H46_015679 [Malus baccata]